MTRSVLSILAEVPVRPDRQTARSWAEEELLKREYQEERRGPLRLLVDWLRSLLDRIPAPGSVNVNLGVTIAILLVVVLVAYVLWRSGGVRRQARARPGDVFDDPALTAADHRRAADAAEAAGDLRTALLERFRALVRGLSDRALVELEAGRTATELTRRAAVRLPALAPRLAAAARDFDDVRYGDRPATVDAVRAMRELDEQAARTSPVDAGGRVPDGLAVPR